MQNKCDICGATELKKIVDGKTIHGPWAYMCERCHAEFGLGFGTGRGQLFDTKTEVKIKG